MRYVSVVVLCALLFSGCMTTDSGYAVVSRSNSHDIITLAQGKSLVVVDPTLLTAEDIAEIQKRSTFVYGYLDIASVHENGESYPGTPLGYDPDRQVMWLQVSDPSWQEYCLERAKRLVAKGVDVLFIDGCDEYTFRRYEGVYQAFVQMLDTLKTLGKPIIINNGDVFLTRALSEQGSGFVNGVNQEGLFTTRMFARRSETDQAYLSEFLALSKKHGLDVYVIEYGLPDRKIISFAKERGYHLTFVSDATPF
ncbi:MAG: endo alpha-1,4 polygalactosaminidase [Sphaerochaeta sp.]|nr:endo alpha-1,4 polygalactosaminidase [Sphaerochaeta sp.]